MRKVTFIACAAALLASVAFTGCKNNEPEGKYNGEVVKTEFAIALPNQLANGPRRMPSAIVQNAGANDFQGMTGIILVPYATQDTIRTADVRLGDNINLSGDVAKADVLKPSSAKVYSDVSIPLSTGSFLFYAKSAADNSSANLKFKAGSLIPTNLNDNSKQLGDFTFDLEPIVSNTAALTNNTSHGGLLLAYLSSVANASDGTKAWYQITDADNAAMKAMFDTYASMHGLSSFEVERVLTDLNKSLKPLNQNALALAIRDSINNSNYATVTNDTVHLIAALADFPHEHRLPEGSIDIAWNGTTHKFTVGSYAGMATPEKYTYPAQLWYYVNSTIKTSNSSKKSMYDNANDWDAVLGAHTDAVSVNSRTRAVAIEHPVQYAVARLDVQVRVKDIATGLEDNSASVVGADLKEDVDCSAGFPVSAILVGGQQRVGWDFTVKDFSSATNPEMTIYDDSLNVEGMIAPQSATAYSDVNHTLVLENGTNDVMMAVELTNTTGVDFYGAGGQLIPKNGKFYVVAKLEAAAATETDGHVFKQDYTTTAKLTLKDLKSAYNTIPDLRTPQLELGFSVDLTWQSGHTYEINFE